MAKHHFSSRIAASLAFFGSAVFHLGACSGTDASDPPGQVVDDELPGGDSSKVTWYRDVLPIAQEACMGCHIQGGSGPFPMETTSLDEYEEQLRPLAAVIAQEVEAGHMPPWQPADGCRELKGVRAITDEQKATILAWVDEGAAPGSIADAPDYVPVVTKLDDVTMTLAPETGYLPTTL